MSDDIDPFEQFKHRQREAWAGFAVNEGFTTPPAAELVRFAGVGPRDRVLDVCSGTGVVALTAARAGANVSGLDLTPELLERARWHAQIAGFKIAFVQGDVEALPYEDASFDVVLSQFGHMFAPRPERALAEMLRVLKPGGRIAFSTWPPEYGMGKLFALIARYSPQPADGTAKAAPPWEWGNPQTVTERLGNAVDDLRFEHAVALDPTLSPVHSAATFEEHFGPLTKLLKVREARGESVAELRADVLAMTTEIFDANTLRQRFLMSRAVKR